jgi:hypothetical protein
MRSPRARDCGILSQGCPQQAWKAIPHPIRENSEKPSMFSFLMFCCLIFQFCYFNYVSRTRVKYLFRATSREYSAVAGVPCSDFLDYSGRYLGEAAEWARQELIERHLQQ